MSSCWRRLSIEWPEPLSEATAVAEEAPRQPIRQLPPLATGLLDFGIKLVSGGELFKHGSGLHEAIEPAEQIRIGAENNRTRQRFHFEDLGDLLILIDIDVYRHKRRVDVFRKLWVREGRLLQLLAEPAPFSSENEHDGHVSLLSHFMGVF